MKPHNHTNKFLNLFEFIFHIQASEFWIVQAFFLHLSLIGASFILGATAADTLFLTKFGSEKSSEMLPYVYLGVAFVSIAIAFLTDFLQKKIEKIKLIILLESFLAISMVIFYILIRQDTGWVYFFLIMWMEVCIALTVTFYFSFLGDYFTSREAKRIYPYIYGGMATGGMLGGYAAVLLMHIIEIEDLLMINAGLLALIGLMPGLISRRIAAKKNHVQIENINDQSPISLASIFSKPYILLVFIFVTGSLIAFVLLDFQLKVAASRDLSNAELASFFGKYYGYGNILQLFIQFVLVAFLFRNLGIANSLMITPVIVFIGSLSYFFNQSLLIIAGLNMIKFAFTESLDVPARELLFFPLPSRVRQRVQALSGVALVPLGLGLGGALLILINSLGASPSKLALTTASTGFLLLIILFIIRSQYRRTLSNSLHKKQLSKSDFREIINRPNGIQIINDLLLSPNDDIVLFALNLVKDYNLKPFAATVRDKLAQTCSEAVMITILDIIAHQQKREMLDLVRLSLDDQRPKVRAEAILCFCIMEKTEAFETIRPYLESIDLPCRIAAFEGIAKYGGYYGALLVYPWIRKYLSSTLEAERLLGAKITARIGGKGAAPVIKKLLEDPAISVREAALMAAIEVKDPKLIPHLIATLKEPQMRDLAIRSLRQMPKEGILILIEILYDKNTVKLDRLTIIQCVSFIDADSAIDVLLTIISTEKFDLICLEAMNALVRILEKRKSVPEKIKTQVRNHLGSICHQMGTLSDGLLHIGGTDTLCTQLLQDHFQQYLEYLLQILMILYDFQQIKNIQKRLLGDNESLQSNAAELIEITLTKNDRHKIIPLIEFYLTQNKAWKSKPDSLILSDLMALNDWANNIVRFFIKENNLQNLFTESAMFNETESSIFHLISIVTFLKKVDLFKDIPGDYLAYIADLVQEHSYLKNEVLFRTGDPGNAFYMIYEGEVAIVIGDKQVAVLKSGEGIGDMALIDGEPRSATAIMKSDSILYCLAEPDFNYLLSSFPSITISLLKTMTKRYRDSLKSRNQT